MAAPTSNQTRSRKAPKSEIVEISHRLIAERLGPGGVAIDATAGNGFDTLFLLRTVGAAGFVYAFDAQEEAIRRARRLLAGEPGGAPPNLILIHGSHSEMSRWIDEERRGRVRLVVFNLGYLPKGAKDFYTRVETTLPALDQALDLLSVGGRLVVVYYQGHEEGVRERAAIAEWIDNLDATRHTTRHIPSSNPKTPPGAYAIDRIG